ncbi:hypothetical protein D0860_02986 [Hortaea werneckii]|uniref:F-box domain-containing protein n=1 Tax=Hortaea werneckii TaxID=91943 RepID=A0A3M7HG16_HORWE|nr:hypothetical protein D0860_02986 [Hortaea werneckii]
MEAISGTPGLVFTSLAFPEDCLPQPLRRRPNAYFIFQFRMAYGTPNPFDLLPIETCQHIGGYLNDRDLCTYRLVCQSTHNAIDADGFSFWRRRFITTFEKPTWTTSNNIKYRQAYHKRRRALMYGADFWVAITKSTGKDYAKEIRRGTRCLEVLRDMIIDSFSEKREGDLAYESKNLRLIYKFVQNYDLLDVVMATDHKKEKDLLCLPKQLLCTIWSLLAPAMLSLDFEHAPTLGFPDSQQVVYGTAATDPIFGGCNGLDINMEWVVHHLNFWKYHMVRSEENTLYRAFKSLSPNETPRFWDHQLKLGGSKLGKHWKGSYAYVERGEVAMIRAGEGQDDTIQDLFNGETDMGQFQDMQLNWLDEADGLATWPKLFEKHLHSLRRPENKARTRAQHRSSPKPDAIPDLRPQNFQFLAEGHDMTEDFCAQGWLNALPAQHGVPGWQRMTMMKYFEDPGTGVIDTDALWAYEGVVLPGGQIMLGRWWCPSDGTRERMYSGPFILWGVDRSEAMGGD